MLEVQIDPPQLTKLIEYYKVRNESNLVNFFFFVEKNAPSFTPPNWGVFAKKMHKLSTDKFPLNKYQPRINIILGFLPTCQESLSAGQVAQLFGSTFPFCPMHSEIGECFLSLFEKNASLFTIKELLMALKGIQHHPNAIEIMELLFKRIDKKNPHPDLLALVTFIAGEVGAVSLVKELEPLILLRIDQFSTEKLINVIKGISEYAGQSVFFDRQTMQLLFKRLLHRLENCNNNELVLQGIFVGSEALSLYHFNDFGWIAFCLKKIHHLQVWDKIGFLGRLAQMKDLPKEFQECLIQVIHDYQSTPSYRIKKYPEDGLLLAHLAGQYCKEEQALICNLLNFMSSHMQTSNN